MLNIETPIIKSTTKMLETELFIKDREVTQKHLRK